MQLSDVLIATAGVLATGATTALWIAATRRIRHEDHLMEQLRPIVKDRSEVSDAAA